MHDVLTFQNVSQLGCGEHRLQHTMYHNTQDTCHFHIVITSTEGLLTAYNLVDKSFTVDT